VLIRILVADDFVPWRRFVSSIVRQQPGWQVVCEALAWIIHDFASEKRKGALKD